jgi:glycosyltransferase involved in cell wall biosynthesis
MIKVLRPTQRAELISARVFDELFSRELALELEIEQVRLLPWLDTILGWRAMPESMQDVAGRFLAATRGFDFFCPDHHAIPLAPICLFLRNQARVPIRLLLIAHAPGIYSLEWVLLRPLLRPGDLIIAPSTNAREVIEFLCPELGPYIRVIPHPMRPLRRIESSGPPCIVSLGRIHPTKLLHRQIEAMAVLSKRRVRLPKMQIAGPLHALGSQEISLYARSLIAKIRRLGLEDHVELIGDIEGNDRKAALLAGARVLMNLSVSIEESFGKAVAEALGVGVPVLATRWNGLPEVVGNGGDCLSVIDVTLAVDVDSEHIADSLERLIAAPPSPEACREQVRRFHPDRVSRMYRVALEDALEISSSSADASGLSDERILAAAPVHGLLSIIAPLPEFSWHELFEFHIEDVARLRSTLGGETLSDLSNGEHLRSLLFHGVRPPLERFLAGLDRPELMIATGQERRRQTSRTDFLSRVSAAAASRATRSSRVACVDLLRSTEQTELLRVTLAALQNDGLYSPTIDFLEIETERQQGHYGRAFQLSVRSEEPILWGEFAAPRLRQLAGICREWGLPGLALPWLREWLDRFPDSPDSGIIWLDRCVNALQTSPELIAEARESFAHVRSLLGESIELSKLEVALCHFV